MYNNTYNPKPFSLRDLDTLIDESTINNINRFAKTFESIFKNDNVDLGSDKDESQSQSQGQGLPMTKLLAHDLIEVDDSYQLIIDIPGVSKENISMNVISQNTFHIKVDKKTNNDLKYLKRERTSGMFMKQISMPKDADLQSITAKYDNGMLNVFVLKKTNPYDNIKVNIL
jgi:HSP20 family protein